MHSRLQFATRESTASPRQHATRTAVSSASTHSRAVDWFHNEPRWRQSTTDSVEILHRSLEDKQGRRKNGARYNAVAYCFTSGTPIERHLHMALRQENFR